MYTADKQDVPNTSMGQAAAAESQLLLNVSVESAGRQDVPETSAKASKGKGTVESLKAAEHMAEIQQSRQQDDAQPKGGRLQESGDHPLTQHGSELENSDETVRPGKVQIASYGLDKVCCCVTCMFVHSCKQIGHISQ